ncbi:MAG: sigma-54 dependent transcriptional regulator [Halofilum sp. (in: g-proteobacteria)]|nr:sigma-54 dependent transcriptional regulator [Halofilum sp. (in: g-proteobacteria)]
MNSAHVLVVDDEPDIRDLLREILEEEGYDVTVAADGATARRACGSGRPDLALLDIWMPDVDGITLLKEWQEEPESAFPVIMMSGHGTIETAVEATRYGAYDYVEKPLSLAKLLLTVRGALGGDEQSPPEAAARLGAGGHGELVGTSRAVAALRERVRRLAATDVTVLVSGEPGTGKRAVARQLHERGPRGADPLVELDLDAVADGDLRAALFGDGGAWTRAAGGTLVLHDLAVLDAPAQATLYEHLAAGPGRGRPRVVALTAADLGARVAERRLRPDLYHALNGASVVTPSLRDNAEDVLELLDHWVNRLVAEEGLTYRHFSVAAQNRLRHYEWPGNVAELVSLVRRLLALGDGVEIGAEEVDAALAELRPQLELPGTMMALPVDLPLREARERFERAYLEHQLRAAGGRIGELARRVGMERTHLYRKLKSLGIEYGSRERG